MKDSGLILIYGAESEGGLAEHIHYQAQALFESSMRIQVLATEDYLKTKKKKYPIKYCLLNPFSQKRFRRLRLVMALIYNQYRLAWEIIVRRPRLVFLSSYQEYLSPLWIWPHIILAKVFRVNYAANLHDPDRNYIVGPKWWHKLSTQLAYIPIKTILMHYKATINCLPQHIKVIQAPVGIYHDVEQGEEIDKQTLRKKWGMTQNLKIFLAFGYIRDDKNLDLFMKVMKEVPEVGLVVMGTVASKRNKPMSYYKQLASELNISDRIFFEEEFVKHSEVLALFKATDYVLLSYSKNFVSQSGVLNIAAKARKLSLVSCGDGPMKECVLKYKTGVFVEPDHEENLKKGIAEIFNVKNEDVRWSDYEKYASWQTNAEKILECV